MGYQSKVTAKGQTTIPVEVRDHLGLKPGDRINYVVDETGVRILAKNRRAADLAAILGPPPRGAGASVEDIDEAIGSAIAEDDERIVREWNETYGNSQ
ncbi:MULTISPECIES: AbrB/MazE/SpoVT family DNA-binding domain-containing protein [unclassified Mesorhizobium]|uniref:AbrB/MazE/SpoVT family DNA-binding domain-containing protein n=1 Tax=unclassified Mesorhizobium TaxID=325217 RepID=UPI003014472D